MRVALRRRDSRKMAVLQTSPSGFCRNARRRTPPSRRRAARDALQAAECTFQPRRVSRPTSSQTDFVQTAFFEKRLSRSARRGSFGARVLALARRARAAPKLETAGPAFAFSAVTGERVVKPPARTSREEAEGARARRAQARRASTRIPSFWRSDVPRKRTVRGREPPRGGSPSARPPSDDDEATKTPPRVSPGNPAKRAALEIQGRRGGRRSAARLREYRATHARGERARGGAEKPNARRRRAARVLDGPARDARQAGGGDGGAREALPWVSRARARAPRRRGRQAQGEQAERFDECTRHELSGDERWRSRRLGGSRDRRRYADAETKRRRRRDRRAYFGSARRFRAEGPGVSHAGEDGDRVRRGK